MTSKRQLRRIATNTATLNRAWAAENDRLCTEIRKLNAKLDERDDRDDLLMELIGIALNLQLDLEAKDVVTDACRDLDDFLNEMGGTPEPKPAIDAHTHTVSWHQGDVRRPPLGQCISATTVNGDLGYIINWQMDGTTFPLTRIETCNIGRCPTRTDTRREP